MSRTWREIAAPIITEVIERVGREDAGRLKRELFEAYPFGERKRHPYKIWLDEIKKQVGTKAKNSHQPDMLEERPR